MTLWIGDVLDDERGEWRVVGRPYSTAGGKTVYVRVESVKQTGRHLADSAPQPKVRHGG